MIDGYLIFGTSKKINQLEGNAFRFKFACQGIKVGRNPVIGIDEKGREKKSQFMFASHSLLYLNGIR